MSDNGYNVEMKDITLSDYIKLLDQLDIDSKLKLLDHLSSNIRQAVSSAKLNKLELLDKVSGAWSDVDDSIIDDIYSSRTFSQSKVELD